MGPSQLLATAAFRAARFAAAGILPALWLLSAGETLAEFVLISKSRNFIQTSATQRALFPATQPCGSCPFVFSVQTSDATMGSIQAPVLSGPIATASLGAAWNSGRFTYDPAGREWRAGPFNSPTQADLDAKFASGSYTVAFSGRSVTIPLAGDQYPVAPLLTLTGGQWRDGVYVVDPRQSFTVASGVYAEYGSHPADGIQLVIHSGSLLLGGGHGTPESANFRTLTVPANTLADGQTANAYVFFSANTYVSHEPDNYYATAVYNSVTHVTIKAELPPPVFPMTVESNITPTTATASAQIQYRPQDVGTSGSVYVFAVAPAGIVKGGQEAKALVVGEARSTTKAGEKAGACVVSQLNSAGQLVAVTFAQLQAYLSGTLSSAGASVSILNNTPTPNVAGSTFYVGYGASSSAMVNDGVFRNAVLVPGTSVCPMLPSLTALWWNPSEPGWGLNLNHQSSTVFGTLFTYDASRAPLWLVMSGGVMQPDGITYTGALYRTTGPAFNANPFTPIGPANLTPVGTMSVSFPDANVGTLTYTVNGTSVSKAIQRQVYGTRAANCLPTSESRAASTNYQDLWWNPAESGWGLNLTHQDHTLFATLFTYDATGRDLWLVMSEGLRQPDGSYLGDLYRTNGPAFNTLPFQGVALATVGTMRLSFTDGNTGTLTYTYHGTPVTKSIQRQVFASPVSACN